MSEVDSSNGSIESFCLTFLERTKLHFDFLVSEYQGNYSSGMYDFKKNRIVRPKFPLTSWFEFRTEFVTRLGTFQITYGDRELLIQAKVQIEGNEYGIWEIFDAFGKDHEAIAGEQFVTTLERVDSVLSTMAISLKENMFLIKSLGKKEVDFIEKRRKKVQDDWYSGIKTSELNSKYPEARKLFTEDKVTEAEELIGPFEKFMNASQKKLLDMIRKKKTSNI